MYKTGIKIVVLLGVFMLISTLLEANPNIANFFKKLPSPQYEHLSNSITSIEQDNEVGFIWVGTRKGLFCYNGSDYREIITVNKALSSTLRLDITKLCFDKRGWLWIGTYKGILVYYPDEDKIIEIENSVRLKNVIVRDLFASESGDVLIGSRNHLFSYRSEVSAICEVTPLIRKDTSDQTPYYFYSFCQGVDSSIWLSSSYGLLNYSNTDINYEEYAFYPYKETFGTNTFSNQQILLENDPDGNLLLGSEKGLYIINVENKTVSPYLYTINSSFSQIRALLFDHKKRLWIGTSNGILVAEDYQKPVLLCYNSEQANSLSDDRVTSLFSDRNNTIWVATYYGGVNYWSDKSVTFKHISDKTSNSLMHKTVKCISKDVKGNLFFGTEQKGISIYHTTSNTFKQNKTLNDFLSTVAVNDILVDKQHIWIATLSDGLLYFNNHDLSQKKYLIDESGIQPDLSFLNNIMSLQKVSDTSLMLGAFHHGLNTFNTKTQKFTNIPLSAFRSPQKIVPAVQKILIDQQGSIWVLAQDDVFQLKKNVLLPDGYDIKQIYNGEVEDGWISDICITKENGLWFSCPGNSLYKYFEGKLTKIDLGKNVEVLSIVEGRDFYLWMSTNVGIVYYNYKTAESRIFNESFGLNKNEFSSRAGTIDNNGSIYFGGASGITVFKPKHILQSRNDSIKTLITNLLVYNNEIYPRDSSGILQQPIAYTKQITLSHKKNMFSLSFAPEDFGLSGSNKFEYRLLSFNDNWIRTSSPKVTYTLQSGGDYTFQVRHVNALGVPSPNVAQLGIKLLNPVWKTPWAYVFYVFITIFFSWWMFSLYRAKTKLKHQLQIEFIEQEKQKELNEQKFRFFTNISHDFRTPLTLIIGTIEQFVKKFPLTSEMHQMLSGAQKNSNQLMSLINDLMDFRKLENKQTRLSVSERDIVSFVKEVFLSFKNRAESNKYNYSFKSNEDELYIYFDAPKIERVMYNLLSNAFKFTSVGGEIIVELKCKTDAVELIVKDSGCGIAPEHIQYIFNRFYEVKQSNTGFIEGTGIGLTIVKNFVELHKGKLNVDSHLNEGSTFTVNLPLGNDHFDPSDIVELQSELALLKQSQQDFSDDDNRKIKAIVDDVLHEKNKKHNILIAEDDEDLGLFLKETLRDYFNIRLEANGLKAYQSVLNNPPDLIISDVVMPVMDGVDFCKKIKANTDSSYIPFIMLTSRTALVYKNEGLESGADDYLNKPFQIKELLLKCANILKTQENFRHNFLNYNEQERNDKTINKVDDYTKALKILSANIDNDAFGVNDLCEKMGLSRSVLYTKMKEWTGQSPGELLLGFRMKKAGVLLEQQKYTVAEVASKVGYKQATYFTKCFKSYYKMLPSEYVNKFCGEF